jgi:Predicted nucleotidyltransferases
MKSLEEVKKILAEHKQEILKKYGVKIIGIFGSYARGEQTKESDVDILLDIENSVGLEFISAMLELERLLGMRVDLVSINAVKQKPLLWESIEEDLVYV